MTGVRILDLTRVLAGPWAAQQLADQGADVIKVEPPGGDETRGFGPVVRGVSTYFLAMNRNKRSIVLDLKTDAGRRVGHALARTCDVVLHNWRPGVAERLAMDWPRLRALRPGLVYVCINAFGAQGDTTWSTRSGYDLVLQAMGGAMSFTGDPGGRPMRAGTPVADLTAGLLATQAVLLGLLHRERTGEGQRIEVNMLQAQHAALVYHVSRQALTGESESPRGNAHRGLVPYDVYRCTDGWLAVACGNDRSWQALREALGIEDRTAWRSNLGRVEQRAAVDAAVSSALESCAVAEAEEVLAAAGVAIGPVLDVSQVIDHPVSSSVGFEHSVLGAVQVQAPAIITRTTRSAHRSPPGMDADRDDVLGELALTAEEVERLGAEGAFGPVGD